MSFAEPTYQDATLREALLPNLPPGGLRVPAAAKFAETQA